MSDIYISEGWTKVDKWPKVAPEMESPYGMGIVETFQNRGKFWPFGPLQI